jgi:hypothetical protein
LIIIFKKINYGTKTCEEDWRRTGYRWHPHHLKPSNVNNFRDLAAATILSLAKAIDLKYPWTW